MCSGESRDAAEDELRSDWFSLKPALFDAASPDTSLLHDSSVSDIRPSHGIAQRLMQCCRESKAQQEAAAVTVGMFKRHEDSGAT